MAANRVMINTSAEADCGSDGAARVTSKMAAVATIRRGYKRYIIVGMGAQNNTSTIVIAPISSGGTYVAPSIVTAGDHSAQAEVVMFNQGEPGFEQAIDARTSLGEDWQDYVKNGVRTCLE